MVFSSLEFIYLFMPPVLLIFLTLRYLRWENAIIWWLIIASLGFYAIWSPVHLALLVASVCINFGLHKQLLKSGSRLVLVAGIAGNLATLGYFKYADFLIGNFNMVANSQMPMLNLVLPLAISFFTFQQIAFLIDTYRGDISTCDFAKYCLFVVFFPQLIAGPIIMQKQTIPQFTLLIFTQRLWVNLSVGSTLFIIGLFKKIVIADGVAPLANSVFALAETGDPMPMAAAWMGTIAYTFQIYFDFSGYCDMALGLARMFGIRLPLNFNSPYKAMNISDFWGRWHMTLSIFLRNFLYIPLGGNRKGPVRRYINLAATMLLGGLWHGASWNFVFWGLLHGFYLSVNHAWVSLTHDCGYLPAVPAIVRRGLALGLTLFSVMIAWVFFRAESFLGAGTMLEAMFGLSNFHDEKLWTKVLQDYEFFWLQAIGLAVFVIWLPNSMEIVQKYRPVIDVKKLMKPTDVAGAFLRAIIIWRPTIVWSMAVLVVGLVTILQIYRLDQLTEFIYFNF